MKAKIFITVFLVVMSVKIQAQCGALVKETQNPTSIGIVISSNDLETVWNAFRFAVTAKKQGHEVKVFLMGEAVECEGLTHEKYNVPEQIEKYIAEGGQILACGTCLKSRQLNETETCPLSTMVDCVNMVTWADRVVTF